MSMTPIDHPADDHLHMAQALELARRAIGVSEPNPRVGCVIVDTASRRVIGEGHTQQIGGPHAEVMALADARARGVSLTGATAYVTLEPCAHHGRTPPCCDALIDAGLARVVVAVDDPFPLVNGGGIQRMRAAGITVDHAPDDQATLAKELNIGFFTRIHRGRPWVRLKLASSLDGRTALPDGRSQWITGEAARADGHAWRRRATAVLTGSGTVLADNPRLDVRHVPTTVQPWRVVVDGLLRTPADARLLDGGGHVLIYSGAHALPGRAQALAERGATVLSMPGASDAHRVDLTAVLADLAKRQVNELHVEAGAALGGALLAAGLVDEILLYVAPMLLGEGRGLADLPVPAALNDVVRYHWHDVSRVGTDLRLMLRA